MMTSSTIGRPALLRRMSFHYTVPPRILLPLHYLMYLQYSSWLNIFYPSAVVNGKDIQLAEIVAAMKHPTTGIKLKEKRYFLKAYAKCFTGMVLLIEKFGQYVYRFVRRGCS
jgi:hypothetical protein